MDLLQETLDMLILKAVSLGPLHGYGILLRIQQISKERLEIQQGSLCPALYRLEHHGWIESEWREAEHRGKQVASALLPAHYSRQSPAAIRSGARWNQMTAVIAGILLTTPEEV